VSALTRWLSLSVLLLLAAPGVARAQTYGASDAPTQSPEPVSLRTEPQAPLMQEEQPPSAPMPEAPRAQGAILDGQVRHGAFLSGPGSLTFILHHSVMGAMGGFFTQGFANGFSFERSSREAMLAGTLIGAGHLGVVAVQQLGGQAAGLLRHRQRRHRRHVPRGLHGHAHA
jgi:hypothetical protein